MKAVIHHSSITLSDTRPPTGNTTDTVVREERTRRTRDTHTIHRLWLPPHFHQVRVFHRCHSDTRVVIGLRDSGAQPGAPFTLRLTRNVLGCAHCDRCSAAAENEILVVEWHAARQRRRSRTRSTRVQHPQPQPRAHLKSNRVTQRRIAVCTFRKHAGALEQGMNKAQATSTRGIPRPTLDQRNTEYAACAPTLIQL